MLKKFEFFCAYERKCPGRIPTLYLPNIVTYSRLTRNLKSELRTFSRTLINQIKREKSKKRLHIKHYK